MTNAHRRHSVLFVRGIRDDGRVRAIKVVNNNRLIYNTEGSCNVFDHVTTRDFDKLLVTLDNNPSQDINVPDIALVFNQISDPDTHRQSLAKAADLCDTLKTSKPCINHPSHVMRLTRDRLSSRLSGIEGVTVPETIRVRPADGGALHDAINSMDCGYPVIIRRCGEHGGRSMVLLESEAGTETIGNSHFGRDCYISRFIDFADDRGIYTKYRLAVVDGDALIRHAIFSDHWIIHSGSRSDFMQRNSWYFDYEKKILEGFEDKLKPRIADTVSHMHRALELDYFGIDCAISNDGMLTVFEANPNMNVLVNTSPTPNMWETPIESTRDRIEAMILSRLPD